MGRIRQSFRRAHHYGSLFLYSDDFAVQTARSSSGLAERSDQVVTTNTAAAAGVRVREICKSFPVPDAPGTSRLALGGISFVIAAGELVSLVGPSGCGKSTLLRLIAGLDVPESGELLVGNEKIVGPNAERGLVFQDPNLFPWLTVRRNIEVGLVARGVLREKRNEVHEFMRLVGLEAFANAYPHHLSGAMGTNLDLEKQDRALRSARQSFRCPQAARPIPEHPILQ